MLGSFIMNQEKTLGELMAILNKTQPELAKVQEAQDASYFNIPKDQGLAKGF